MRLLYVEASPLESASHSVAVASAFLEAYQQAHPQDEIDRIDLWSQPLPPFNAKTIEAKFAVLRLQQFTQEQFQRWDAVRQVSKRFNAADKYVFGVPMWNFGIPYPLKHYIDVVTLPGENWTWSRARGYETLLSGKKALLIYTSANDYTQEANQMSDFQKPYMRRWLRFIGVEDLQEINLAPTLADPALVAQSRATAIREATGLAAGF